MNNPDDIAGLCGLCGTLIHHGEQDAIDGEEEIYHSRCLTDRFAERVQAVREIVKISQETGQYDYNYDHGGD